MRASIGPGPLGARCAKRRGEDGFPARDRGGSARTGVERSPPVYRSPRCLLLEQDMAGGIEGRQPPGSREETGRRA